jgi:hypothetical protein
LVYGQEAIFSIEIELLSLRIALEERLEDEESLKQRYDMLEKLEETRTQAYLNMVVAQKHQKIYYDSKLEPKVLKENDLILLYDSRFSKFPRKFKMRWFGPYRILKSYPNGSMELQDFARVVHSIRYNGHRLKPYIT